MRKWREALSCILIVCMMAGSIQIPGMQTIVVQAQSLTETTAMSFVGVNSDKTGNGYTWEASEKILTLEDGFVLQTTGEGTSAMTLKPGTKIVLKGNASINTDDTGIDAMGDVTITSAEGVNGKLTIRCSKEGAGSSLKYGVKVENNCVLSVTGDAILDVGGTSKGALYATSEDGAFLSVTDRGEVILANANAIGVNNFKLKSPERVIWDADNQCSEYTYLTENTEKALGTRKNLKLLACTVDGTANGNKTQYTQTYDGENRKVHINTSELKNVRYNPSQISYLETQNSEYTNTEGSDYRDKKTGSSSTSYQAFTADQASPLNASTYNVTYKTRAVANLEIRQREVVVTGLTTRDKTYDGWPDAAIDYSQMTITAVNGNDGDTTGIVPNDEAKLGKEIIPYAKAFFLKETQQESDMVLGGKKYEKCKDVAYVNDKIENGVVDTRKVFITEILLSDPNYWVIPYTDTKNPSQKESQAKIYPRDLKDSEYISCYVNPTEFSWTKDYKWKNVEKKVFDTSSATPNSPLAQPVELVAGTDYTLSHNSYNEVGKQTVKFTGRANYAGSITADWTIYKAVRQITINENKKRVYDKTAYPVTVTGAAFNYKIMDVSNNDNVTAELETGSALSITYKGRGDTVYSVSENAPVNAGDYTVTISVKETAHYTAAEKSLDFTIAKKPVALEWICGGRENGTGLSKMTYNGKPNVFITKVTNAIAGDSVSVNSVTYSGTTTGGVVYTDSAAAPKEAGSFTVKATSVDNPNYTVIGSNAHNYTVDKAVVTLKWEKTGEQIYSTKDLTPVPVVQDLFEKDVCKVNGWSYSGTDVYGNAYTAATRAYNVSKGNITVKATAVDNPNYILTTDAENIKTVFTIVPLDLGTLKSPEELFAHKIDYSGYQVAPELEWKKDDCGEVLKRNRDYTSEDFSEASEPAEQNMRIVIEGKNNYKGTNHIFWNIDKLASSITITNYKKNGENPFAVTYGEKLPALTFTYENRDVEKDYNHTLESAYLEYTYTGTMANGKEYKKTSTVQTEAEPSQAGTYKVTVKLIETDHYLESTAEADFVILPKSITIKAGVKGADKEYDGKKTAKLDFKAVILDGIEETDAKTVSGLFAKAEKDYVSYEAVFTQKDVLYKMTSATGREVADVGITFEKPALILEKGTPDVFFNYKIAGEGNQKTTEAKIVPKPVTVSGVKAKDKVYDGTTDVMLDTTGLTFKGVAEGESLTVEVNGAFTVSGNEPEPEDVFTDDAGNAAAKPVALSYQNLEAGNENTLIDNYCLAEKGQQTKTTAVISPAALTITGIEAEDKYFDNTNEAKNIDWTKAKVNGVRDGDIVTISENNVFPLTGTYADAEVAYDVNGEVVAKTVTTEPFTPELSGSFWKENYYIKHISITGKILPVKLKEIVWTFDEETQLPSASLSDDSGLLEGDKDNCSVLMAYFEEEDTTFQNPLGVDDLQDNGRYIAKVIGFGNGNYALPQNTDTLTYSFVYDIEEDVKKESSIEINNYRFTSDGMCTVEYGTALPMVEVSWENDDVTEENRDDYISVSYNGTQLNGEHYESTDAPTQAGVYYVKVYLAETEHYLASAASAVFRIAAIPLTVSGGIKGVDKIYNGTTKAELDFDDISFTRIPETDALRIRTLLSDKTQDYIRYTADFEQKDVKLKETENGMEADEVGITISKFEFIYNENTPEVFYNYTLSKENVTAPISAKLLQRPVKVSGITAKDKTYDGNAQAELVTANAQFTNNIKGDVLTVSASGIFTVSENGLAGAYVLLDENGKAQAKNVQITLTGLKAANETTNADNYCLAEEGQQTDTVAVIRRAAVTVKDGIKGVDKIYDGGTEAELDFKNVVLEGIVEEDKETIGRLFDEAEDDYISYQANFVQKDVLRDEESNEVTNVAIEAGRLAFLYKEGKPVIFHNYTLRPETTQTTIESRILPRPVKVSGIKAKNKTYDASDKAEFIANGAEFAGRIYGEKLTVSANGIFEITEDEPKGADVILGEDGKEKEKKVTITWIGLLSADENTVSGNYCLAEEGQQTQTTAVIRQAKIKKVNWSFNEKTQLPTAQITEACGIIEGSEDVCVPDIRIYAKNDAEFTTPLTTQQMKDDERYVARVEAVDNTNYVLSEHLLNPVYTFIYDIAVTPEPAEEKPAETITEAQKTQAALALDAGIFMSLKNKKLQIKWGRVEGADGYYVYLGERGKEYSKPRTITGNRTSFSITRVNKKKVFRGYVAAYKLIDGKPQIIAASREVSCAGEKIKNYNAKKLRVKEKTVTLIAGGTKKLSATVTLTNGKKKTGKKAKLVYWSTNPAVAEVSADGTITAKAKGTCIVYVMARNGKKKSVKITVN